jgi:hypothetical protein
MFRSVKTTIRLTYIYSHSQATELQRYMYIYILHCSVLLKARISESEWPSIARQQLGNQVRGDDN